MMSIYFHLYANFFISSISVSFSDRIFLVAIVIDNLSNFLLSFGEYFDDVHFSVSFHVVDSAPMRINKC